MFSTATATSSRSPIADAGGATVQQTLTATNGTLTLSTIAGLTFALRRGVPVTARPMRR